MATPFDYITAVSYNKKDMFQDEQANREYSPFIVNRGLSYFHDTIMYANEMNRNPHLDKDCQFYFLLNSISKNKRFSKWSKKDPISKNLELVKEYFGYSDERAKEALSVLTKDDLKLIKEKLDKGGR